MGDCARPYTVPHNGQGLKPSRSENDPTRKIFSTFPINADFSGWPSVRGSSTSWNRSSWNNVGLTMSLTRFTLECSSKLMLSRETIESQCKPKCPQVAVLRDQHDASVQPHWLYQSGTGSPPHCPGQDVAPPPHGDNLQHQREDSK